MIRITDIKISKVENNKDLKGFAMIVIDDAICIRNIRIIEGKERIFLAMPSKKDKKNVFRDFVYPINQETREYIEEMILKAYRND